MQKTLPEDANITSGEHHKNKKQEEKQVPDEIAHPKKTPVPTAIVSPNS